MKSIIAWLSAPGTSAAQREAEAWIVRLESGACTTEDRRRFEAWLDGSEENLAAYLETEGLHQAARSLSSDPRMQRAARTARTGAPAPAAGPWLKLAAVASVCAIALLGYRASPFFAGEQAQVHANGAGPPREVLLADGTRVKLDADTEVTVARGRSGTGIALAHGRIFLRTNGGQGDGLEVSAGSGLIRDIGTGFEVDRRSTGDVRVSVFDGVVLVSMREPAAGTATLRRGQRLAYSDVGKVGPVEEFDPAPGVDWAQGRLVFQDESLGAIVEEMNRYSAEKIRLQGPELASLRLSGTFEAGDQRAFLDMLRRGWNLSASRDRENNIVVSVDGSP